MCLDQLGGVIPLGLGDYNDDDGALEEDDEVHDGADLEIDEEGDFEGASDGEEHHRTQDDKGDRTSKSENL